MSSIAIAGCIAFVWSLAVLSGLAAYFLLWWLERAYPKIVSTLGAYPGVNVLVFLIGVGLLTFNVSKLLHTANIVVFPLALVCSIWLHKAKYHVLTVEALLLILNAGGVSLLGVLIAGYVMKLLFPELYWFNGLYEGEYFSVMFVTPWLGVFAGPAVGEHLESVRQDALNRLRNSSEDKNSTI